MLPIGAGSCLLAVLALAILRRCNHFRLHLHAAKQSGIPYVIIPVTGYQPLWLLTYQLWLPLIELLPRSWTSSWIDFLTPGWAWIHLHKPYKSIGSDFFLTVSPFGNILWVCDANMINQITTRRNDFPKDTRIYRFIDIYGKNLVTTEGNDWVRHRKVTAPTFSEKNNHIVWTEALYQTQEMLKIWDTGEGTGPIRISNALEDIMKLSLHVISQAGFGRRMFWTAEANASHDKSQKEFYSQRTAIGHSLSFADALSTVLDKLLLVALIPHWILAIAPFKFAKSAYLSYTEWGRYMDEMYQEKKHRIMSEDSPESTEEGFDLLGALIRSTKLQNEASSEDPSGIGQTPEHTLSEREVLGNAFIFMFGGHETTASTIYYSLVFLAMCPSSQRLLQSSLDAQFPSSSPTAPWNYDTELPRLLSTMPGAVINETLRLIPPIMQMPKTTLDRPQALDVGGRTMYVPPNTKVNIVISAAHRNPNFWPASEKRNENTCDIVVTRELQTQDEKECLVNDLDNFRPERWLLSLSPTATKDADTPTPSPMTLPYRPQRGAYIPFSDGRRSCIGRRFALVEAVAVIASIFRSYSIELDVDTADVVGKKHTLKDEWHIAAEKARYATREGLNAISFQRKKSVPLRLVRRGNEQFWDMDV